MHVSTRTCVCMYVCIFLSTYSTVLFTYLAQNRPDDGHMTAETCSLKRQLICDYPATRK